MFFLHGNMFREFIRPRVFHLAQDFENSSGVLRVIHGAPAKMNHHIIIRDFGDRPYHSARRVSCELLQQYFFCQRVALQAQSDRSGSFHAGEWVFHDPAITPDIDEEFDNALETDSQGNPQDAERIVRGIVRKCPNHIDALHHLSIWIEERGDTLTAYAFCQAAVAVGLHAIPRDFHWDRSHLPWGHLDNRPFLRAYHALAIHRIEHHAWDAAIEILGRLLRVNPNDNQGARYELPACWFETGDISAVIDHCAYHNDDASPFILYPAPSR